MLKFPYLYLYQVSKIGSVAMDAYVIHWRVFFFRIFEKLGLATRTEMRLEYLSICLLYKIYIVHVTL